MDFQKILNDLGGSFSGTLPRLLTAFLILIVGLFIARILRKGVKRALVSWGIDRRIDPQNKTSFSLADSLSKIVYWIVLVYLLMYILGMVGVNGVLDPLRNMLNEITSYVPNLLGAGLIGFIGYTIANIGKEATGMLSEAVDGLSHRLGINTNLNITRLLQQLVFLVIFIPVILVALDTLNISAISDPAKAMLTNLFNAIPNIIAAAVLLFVFVVGGRFVSSVVKELLVNLKVDETFGEMGVSTIIGNNSVSTLASKVVYFFLVLFGLVSATEKLQLQQVTSIMNEILDISGHILFGMIILFVGNQISLFIQKYFNESGGQSVSTIARFATLGLFLAISLKYMGIADDIVNLAFGLTLGAVAVAFALSFGLGGREAAGKEMKRFFKRFNGEA